MNTFQAGGKITEEEKQLFFTWLQNKLQIQDPKILQETLKKMKPEQVQQAYTEFKAEQNQQTEAFKAGGMFNHILGLLSLKKGGKKVMPWMKDKEEKKDEKKSKFITKKSDKGAKGTEVKVTIKK